MRRHHYYYTVWLPLLVVGAVLGSGDARRIRIEPREQQDDEAIQYYAAEPQEEEQQQVVLVSSADQYNGLYGQPTASSRNAQENYIPQSRKALAAAAAVSARVKEHSKSPPVQTIRNYNKVNDDGSFTFGYEAADGSFKEETRGTDCVVRGKYGYVDPDGNKREFTYVSGNPCDPNAPKEEQDEPQEQEGEPENVPANYPTRPIRPLRPVAPKPAVTLFQNTYDQSEEEQPEPEQVLTKQQPSRRPAYISRPQYVQQTATEEAQIYHRPQLIPATTPASVLYRQTITPINITPRPVTPTPSARAQLPATTYRPQLLQVAVTPRPELYYTKQLQSPSSTIAPSRGSLDFDAEFQKFQQENNIVSPTPSALLAKAKTTKPAANPGQIYSSALVFDPSSGQYNTQLYQTLPQTEGDFSLNHRIQPYVHQPQRPVLNLQQLQHQSPLYSQQARQNPQAAYQQQQAELQFQNSAQLFAQQQRARAQQRPHHPQPQQQHQQQPQQQVYYIQPSVDHSGPLANGQIDAFLRGHNIQF